MTAAYSIYFCPGACRMAATLSRYKEEVLPDGSRLMVTRPDLLPLPPPGYRRGRVPMSGQRTERADPPRPQGRLAEIPSTTRSMQ